MKDLDPSHVFQPSLISGAQIALTILTSPNLGKQRRREVEGVAHHVMSVWTSLVSCLKKDGSFHTGSTSLTDWRVLFHRRRGQGVLYLYDKGRPHLCGRGLPCPCLSLGRQVISLVTRDILPVSGLPCWESHMEEGWWMVASQSFLSTTGLNTQPLNVFLRKEHVVE